MNDADNYAVIGLTHYNAMRDRLAVLEYENANLREALDNAVTSHQQVQERLLQMDEGEEDAP